MATIDEALSALDPKSFAPEEVKPAIKPSAARLVESADMSPDTATQVVQQSRQFNVPQELLGSEPDADLARQGELAKAAQTLRENSGLDRYLGELKPAEVAMVRDDLEGMGKVEQAVRSVLGFARDSGKSMYVGVGPRLAAGAYGGLQAFGDIVGSEGLSDLGRQWRQAMEADAKRLGTQSDNTLTQGWMSGMESAGQMIGLLPAAIVTGNPNVALGPMVASVFGSEYGKAKDEGLSTPGALSFGGSQAMIEFLTERLPAIKLLEDINLGSGLGKILMDQLKTELPGEQLATALQDFNEWAYLNPDKPFGDYLAARPEAALQTAVATLAGAGALTAATRGAERVARLVAGDDERIKRSEEQAKLLEQIAKLAESSQVRQRDMQTFEGYVNSLASDSPVQNLYISADALMQSGKAEKLAAESPTVAEQLKDAIATGGDVRIPVAEVMGRLGDTVQEILPDLKVNPAELSVREAEELQKTQMDDLKVQVEKIMGETGDNPDFIASRERVAQQITQTLDSLGRFNNTVNKIKGDFLAAYMSVQAHNLGIMPEEFAAKYMPNFVGSEQVGIEQGVASITEINGLTVTPFEDDGAVLSDMRLQPGVQEISFEDVELPTPIDNAVRTPQLVDTISKNKRIAPILVEQDANGVLHVREGLHRAHALMALGHQSFPAVVAVRKTAETLKQSRKSDAGHKRVGSSGRYVGAPDWVGSSPSQLAYLRKKLKSLAVEGESGRYWYERSSRSVLDLVGGDKAEAEKVVGLLAIYSQGTEVNLNLGFALEVYFQWKAGLPIDSGRFPTEQTKKAEAWLFRNEDWGGIKTNNFYADLMEEIDPSKVDGEHATMDMWMALAFDYGAKVLDQGPKYNFAKRETIRLAEELGWKPHQVQAAIWTSIKARVEQSEKARKAYELKKGIATSENGGHSIVKGKEYEHFRIAHRFGMAHQITPEEIAALGFDFADALNERMVQLSWEATPSAKPGRSLPGIHAATTAQKFEYLQAMRAALTENGRDVLADMAGIPQGTTAEGFSAWEGAVGAGAQTLIPAPSIGTGKKRSLLEVARDAIEMYATLKGYILEQDSVVYHSPVWEEAKVRQNGVHLSTATPLTEAEVRMLYQALHDKFGTWDLAPGWRPDGVRILNFTDVSNADFRKGLDEILAALPEGFAGGTIERSWFRSDGGFVANDWTENPNGEGYRSRVEARRPDLLGRLADLRARAQAVNADFAARYGWDKPGALLQSQLPRDRGGRDEGGGLAPLEGAPAVAGAAGPDPDLVAVAERYAAENGIVLRRQAEYVEVDEDRARRIAAAYEAMPHAPQDVAVKEAYENLVRQTVAQYKALEAAGYRFWFFDGNSDPYDGNPWNAMRDLRATKSMAVFSTAAGFGSGYTDLDVNDNPLLADTGIKWPYGSPAGELRPVLANDLFRAVHDAFGHGLEGAGFRARGEENAWQAHARLFTGSALAALTSETRGQNSWLNYGPFGEQNRTAKVLETMFADQKTGLMPEWTWTEGRLDDIQSGPLEQSSRGSFDPTSRTIAMLEAADLSTFFHESAHFFLDLQTELALQPDSPARVREDLDKLLMWQKVEGATPEERLANFAAMRDALNARIRGGLKQSVPQTETSEFKNWFGDSKAVVPKESSRDKSPYKPMRFFHSTRGNFDAFEVGRKTSNTGTFGSWDTNRHAIFFTPDPSAANEYSTYEGKIETGANTVPVYLKASNPLDLTQSLDDAEERRILDAGVHISHFDWEYFDGSDGKWFVEKLKELGYDSVVFNETRPDSGEQMESWAVFDPTHIKSAIGNDGSFDPNNPSILKQGGTTPSTNDLADRAVKIHEAVAESFEQYLREGKAPSAELQGIFRTLRSWLKWIYKKFTDMYNVTQDKSLRLNDEVRAVFDRLLATDEEIAVARSGAAMGQLFTSQAEAEKFGVDWQNYHELAAADVASAQEELSAKAVRDLRWLENTRMRMLKELTKQANEVRRSVRADVERNVKAMPVYQAIRWLRTGEMTVDGEEIKAEKGFRLNTNSLKTLYPESGLDNPDLEQLKGMTSAEGLEPDVVAEMFGFRSGDALIRALIDAQPIKDVVDAKTQQRMLEEHSELSDEQEMQEAVSRALHGKAHARFLATELAALEKAMSGKTKKGTSKSGRAVTERTLPKAAEQFAIELVSRAKIGDLTPRQYEAAAAKAAKQAEKAFKAGKLEEAATHKRNELVNVYAAQAARAALAEARKAQQFFQRVLNSADAKLAKNRDLGMVNAARAVLSNFGFGSTKARSAMPYLEMVRQYDPDVYAAVESSVRGAEQNAKPFPQLTVEEVKILFNEVDALWSMSKRMRVMEVAGNQIDRDEAAKELAARMVEIGVPSKRPGQTSAVTPGEQFAMNMATVKAALRRVEAWVTMMDDGDMGPFRRLVWQPIKDAADKYRADKADYITKFRKAFDGIAGTMKRGTIEAPELGYTFGKDSGGVAMNEILHALLHTGNDSNKRKLLLGRGWATEIEGGGIDTSRWDMFVARLIQEGRLTKDHFDFLQSTWDLLEEMKPGAQAAHRDAYGKYFDEVTANPFTNKFGTYRGGYVPAMTDARIVKDIELKRMIEEGNEDMTFAFPGTGKGFTQKRVEYNSPLMLDLRTLPQHIDKVLKFTHLENPVRDVAKLLATKTVSDPLNAIQPEAINGMLRPWLTRAARQQVTTPVVGAGWMNKILNTIRARTSLATMFANVSNTAQQITGFSLAGVKVPPSQLLSATAAYLGSPWETAKKVGEMSPYMKGRMSNEVSAMLDEIESITLDPNVYQKTEQWTKRHQFFMQSAVDNVMGPIVWMGAYKHALEGKFDHDDAVRIADSVIRQTQGSSLPEDVSRIETGPALVRLFTQFAGYFNMQANLLGTEFGRLTREMGMGKLVGRGLYVALLGFAIPAIVAEAIAQAFRGGPDDEDDDGAYLDDWIMATVVYGQIRNATAFVPGAGQLVNSAVARFNENPLDDRISVGAAVGALERAGSVPHDLYKIAIGEARVQKTWRDVATLATLMSGLPVATFAKPAGYVAGTVAGEIEPTSDLDAVRGVISGVASPGSR